MDFQSAARFGERRVMVTDYDETAVEVNAKVVDEDTGEVICECGGGGGGESVINAIVTLDADSTGPLSLGYSLKVASELMEDPTLEGYTIETGSVILTKDAPTTILTLSSGLSFVLSTTAEVIDGEATITNVAIEDGTIPVLTIKGSCTLHVGNK